MKKFFLIGMPGSGKSYWANELKSKLKLPAYDVDALIEASEQKSIADIFKQKGEAYFRKIETGLLRSFANKPQFILSCGGGSPCFHNNMQWMNEHGVTIWLDVPVEILEQRLANDKAQRPLINELKEQQLHNYLHQTLQIRTQFYQQAMYKLHGNEISEQNLLKILKQHA